MAPIGTPHSAGNVEAVTVSASFPPVPIGQIKLLTTWTGWVPAEGVLLPFKLQVDDWIVAVVVPTLNSDDRVRVTGMSLAFSNGYVSSALYPGVDCYRVVSTSGTLMLTPQRVGATAMVALLIYRGVQEAGKTRTLFSWNVPRDLLSARQEPLPYSAPAAEIARITLAPTYPELPPFSYSPSDTYSSFVVPSQDYDINPNWQVTVEINSRKDLSPADDTTVSASGAWDPKYANDGWGSAEFYTVILTTQAVDLMPADPDNPAPVGGAHLPVHILPRDEPLGIVDEEDNQLVDENDDTLIWS